MITAEEFNEPWLYRVFFREGLPVMAVLMGGIAQYEKEVVLTEAQYETFQKTVTLRGSMQRP
jgi:hypothetical protein